MAETDVKLTEAEWSVMECLWKKSPITGREAIEWLKESMGWSRSTTLTLLRRMEEKGAVGSENDGTIKLFVPLLSREQAALQETEDFLGRVYKGSLGMMLSAFTKKQNLSKQEIAQLHAILDGLELDGSDKEE